MSKEATEEYAQQLIETFLKWSEKIYDPNFISNQDKAKLFELYPHKAQVYIEYLSSISLSEGIDQNMSVLGALLNHETEIDQQCLQALKDICEENQKPNPRVEKGLEVLRDFFKKPKPVIIVGKDYDCPWKLRLQFFSAVILIFGSLEFRDPRNLDADIVIAASCYKRCLKIGENKDWIFKIETIKELLPYWFERGMGNEAKDNEPHINIVDLTIGHSLLAFIKNYPDRYESFAEHLSVVLSGMLLYPEDQGLFERIQKEARDLIESDPLTCAIVNYQLRETLDIRLERRKEKEKV